MNRIIHYSHILVLCKLWQAKLEHQKERLRKNRETMHMKLGKEVLVLGEKFMYLTAFYNCATDKNYLLSHVLHTL